MPEPLTVAISPAQARYLEQLSAQANATKAELDKTFQVLTMGHIPDGIHVSWSLDGLVLVITPVEP